MPFGFPPNETQIRPPEPVRRLHVALVLGLVLISDASGQLPEGQFASPDSSSVRNASTVFLKPYETASKREEAAEAEIEAVAGQFLQSATGGSVKERSSSVAASFGTGGIEREAWWNEDTRSPILVSGGKTLRLGLGEIYRLTLEHSNQVKAIASVPLIRETGIAEAEGEFEIEAFAKSRYDRRLEPSGSTLEREDPGDIFRERAWTFESGLRKRLHTGATVELRQELSATKNNSDYFSPAYQGRGRFTLAVMQPLLRGAGTTYNRSLIQIAKLDAGSGYSEFIGKLENHLMEVNRLYWELYLARGVHLEKRRLVTETESVVAEIESRSDLDSISSQRSRARAALASRKADLVRSELEVKNAESRLRTLVNDPAFFSERVGEIIPADPLIATMAASDFDKSVGEALGLRPEIELAENKFRAAVLREGIAKNEKLPAVDLIGEIGTSTLRGEGDWTGAFNEQFNGGEPTWGVGIVASIPLERKTAKARHLRSQLEMRQARDELRATLDEVLLDVQIAHREAVTAWPDTRAKWEAAEAAEQELAVLRDRRDVETVESGTSLYLEKLLDAQQRLAFAREDFLLAIATYNTALANLERAKGTLLQREKIGVERTEDEESLPLLRLVKDEAARNAKQVYQSLK